MWEVTTAAKRTQRACRGVELAGVGQLVQPIWSGRAMDYPLRSAGRAEGSSGARLPQSWQRSGNRRYFYRRSGGRSPRHPSSASGRRDTHHISSGHPCRLDPLAFTSCSQLAPAGGSAEVPKRQLELAQSHPTPSLVAPPLAKGHFVEIGLALAAGQSSYCVTSKV
jgi:hypothetical protein